MRNAIILLLIGALAACATAPQLAAYRPVVDSIGHDPDQIDADAAYCHSLARQTPAWRALAHSEGNTAGAAVLGALFGAAIGAALGDGFKGHQGSITRYGAGVGAAHGAAYGVADSHGAAEAYRNVVRECMSHRGYIVYH